MPLQGSFAEGPRKGQQLHWGPLEETPPRRGVPVGRGGVGVDPPYLLTCSGTTRGTCPWNIPRLSCVTAAGEALLVQ